MLGDRLKALRKERNITQTELAKKLKTTRGTYAHYEINKRQPDYETLEKIADFFEVSIDWLLGRVENPKGFAYASEEEDDKIWRELVRRWVEMSDEEREKYLKVMDAMYGDSED